MRVRFWGTRGSIPASVTSPSIRRKILRVLQASKGIDLQDKDAAEEFLRAAAGGLPFSATGTYGTNTSCMEITGGSEYVMCDAGTGIRDLGNSLTAAELLHGPQAFNIFMSHLHWDHIQGFPFFAPAFMPGKTINIFGLHEELEHAFVTQQEYPFFPVPLKSMGAAITFTVLEPGKAYEIGGFTVRTVPQNHPGRSYGYRFEKDGRSVVYSTDSEHKAEAYNDSYPFLDFVRDADLLIFDSQYSFLDAMSSKENWGHSSNIMAVELGTRARVKGLCIFHNEPTLDDEALDRLLDDTRRYAVDFSGDESLKIHLACDGLEIEV